MDTELSACDPPVWTELPKLQLAGGSQTLGVPFHMSHRCEVGVRTKPSDLSAVVR